MTALLKIYLVDPSDANLLLSRVGAQKNVNLIRLNRPKALNALNSDLMAELSQALRQADLDQEVACSVLTGSKKAFAAGADIVRC